MNIQALRYIVEIERIGSINKAAQQLYVSQSTLSRCVKELEAQINISIFRRTNKGVVPTHDGQVFIGKIKCLLGNINQLEDQYFNPVKNARSALFVATQRCSPVVQAFLAYYKTYCRDEEFLNLALQEETTDNIIHLLCGRIYSIGILHYTSDREEKFLETCKSLDLEVHLLHKSPVCAQVRKLHPLANEDGITVDMLSPYPHVTYSDEDITSINYCSDIFQYNQSLLKKRIIVQDRGTLLQVINETDGYYIGCDFSCFDRIGAEGRCYIPLRDVKFTLNTIWVQQSGRSMTQAERTFIQILEDMFAE